MDISTNITQPGITVPAIPSEQAVQAKVPTDSSIQGELSPKVENAKVENPKIDARLVPNSIFAAEKQKREEQKDLDQAVTKLNDFVQSLHRDLQFSIDEKSGEMVVKVIDSKTQKVIRQIPSEEALMLAHSLAELNDDGKLTIFSSTA